MILVYGIIAALAATALVQGALECNLTQAGPQKCFGAFEEPLIFYLSTNPNENTRLTKNTDHILQFETSSFHINGKFKNSITFFINGTFKLNKATKRDSGEYKVEIYNSTNGKLLHTKNLQLNIQAPVSEPAVSQTCLSPERMTVRCSSDGDEMEFMLSLDDNLLIQTRNRSSEKQSASNITISLHGQLMGKLKCTVQNNVSREQTTIHLTGCTGTISHVSAVTVSVAATTAILLLILAAFLGLKHFNKKTDPMTVTKGYDEDDVVYSDVRVKQHTRKTASSSHAN